MGESIACAKHHNPNIINTFLIVFGLPLLAQCTVCGSASKIDKKQLNYNLLYIYFMHIC